VLHSRVMAGSWLLLSSFQLLRLLRDMSPTTLPCFLLGFLPVEGGGWVGGV
jgi:hypothetical protein